MIHRDLKPANVSMVGSLFFGLFYGLFLFLVLRLVLRRHWLAAGVMVMLLAFMFTGQGWGQLFSCLGAGLAALVAVLVLLRFGLLALCINSFVFFLLSTPALTANFSAWYAGNGLWTVALFLAIAGFGFFTALGGRPLLGKTWLGEE